MKDQAKKLKKRVYQFVILHKYLLPFWDKQLLLFFCSIGFISFGVLTPYLSRMVVDYGILRKDFLVFKIFLLCGMIIFLFSSLIGIIQKYISFFVNIKMGFKIRMDYYDILCRKPLSFFEKRTTGELLYRISTDTNGVINLITGTIPNVLLTLVRLILISAICIWLNWKAALFVVSVMPLFYLLNHYFGKKSFRINKEINEKGQLISNKLQDNLSLIKLYKAFYREKKGINTYKKESTGQIRILIRNFWLGIANEHTTQVLNNGVALLITFYLGSLVLYGKMTLGGFIALTLYLSQLSGILKSLGGIYQGIVSQFVYVDRFFEIFEKPGRKVLTGRINVPELYGGQREAILFKDVAFGYNPDRMILKDLNFAASPGETVAIIGNSGEGKSTIAKLILRLYKTNLGKLFIYGSDINTLNESDIGKTVGIALQETPLLNKTIMENITFGNDNISNEDLMRVAHIAEVYEFVKRNKLGFDLNVGEHGSALSRGQCQRIAIAMALMKNPSILILDEATNQLDQEMEERIIHNIRKYWPLISLIIISCRRSTLKIVDKVYELKKGALTHTVVMPEINTID